VPRTTQTSKPINKIRLVNDIVPLVDGLGLVTGDLHRDTAWHTGPLEVPNGGAT
tara:strand:- start:80 stop:241 length:162 start_codon:yes stop_codon:yes gene_type:complete